MAFFTGIPDSKKHVLIFMALLNLASAISFQGWTLLYNNYVVNEAGLTAAQSGLIQGMREIPGLLGFTLIFFLLFIREHRFAAICVIAAGLGTMLTGLSPHFLPIVFASMLMSFGFHYYESMNNSLAIEHFDLVQTPLVMGRLRGLVAGGSLMISLFIFAFSDLLSFTWLFFVPGAIGVALARANPEARLTLADVNRRALRLAEENAAQAQVSVRIRESDGFGALADERFDTVVTNPPIRAGKQVIYRMFADAAKALRPGGALYLVIRKQQGAESCQKYLRTLYAQVERLDRSRGYWVLRAAQPIMEE